MPLRRERCGGGRAGTSAGRVVVSYRSSHPVRDPLWRCVSGLRHECLRAGHRPGRDPAGRAGRGAGSRAGRAGGADQGRPRAADRPSSGPSRRAALRGLRLPQGGHQPARGAGRRRRRRRGARPLCPLWTPTPALADGDRVRPGLRELPQPRTHRAVPWVRTNGAGAPSHIGRDVVPRCTAADETRWQPCSRCATPAPVIMRIEGRPVGRAAMSSR